jgi:hypothetical protein
MHANVREARRRRRRHPMSVSQVLRIIARACCTHTPNILLPRKFRASMRGKGLSPGREKASHAVWKTLAPEGVS